LVRWLKKGILKDVELVNSRIFEAALHSYMNSEMHALRLMGTLLIKLGNFNADIESQLSEL